MTRHIFPEYCHIPLYDCIRCCSCGNRVAVISDCILTVQPAGVFNRVFNVEVSDDVNDHRRLDVNTLAKTYCVSCRTLLGWQFIAVPQPSMFIREGRFLLRLHKISFWNDIPLLRLNEEQDLDANEENADQDAAPNEQNADRDEDADEQVPNEQDGGANEQNADQDGGVDEQVHNQDVDIAEGMAILI